jgi:type VI secretion system protein ImpC
MTNISFGSIRVGVRPDETPAAPREDTPFRILVLGDFSGKASRGAAAGAKLNGLRPIAVDRDNIETVMARLGIELQLPAGDGNRLSLRFQELDDFRPERIFQRLEAFDRLRQMRQKLADPATFAAAAAEMRAAPAAPPPSAAKPNAPAPQGEALLDAVLGATADRAEAAPGGVDWDRFLRQIVSGYAVPRADPRQAEMIAMVDQATAGFMRALLHQADFQALEALWRGLYFLVRRLDTDAQLKLFLLDLSRGDLTADLNAGEDLATTGLYRLLVEQTVGTPGAPPWSALVGHYSFGAGPGDAALLGRLAKIAAQAGAPFVAAAHPSLIGCASLAQTPDPAQWQPLAGASEAAWAALRGLPEARYLGLALPRFLLRLPYGKETDAVEAFDFEELRGGDDHEGYLWGNPAIACAYLLGETFSHKGWDMRPGLIQDIDNLPAHVFQRDGEPVLKPCAEVSLGTRAVERIAERGLMPLLSFQGRDSVQLASFRSVAGEVLAGRWQ